MTQFLPDSVNIWLPDMIQIMYLIATAFFIRGIKLLNSPQTARRGNQLAATGMLIGLVVTLFDQGIVSFDFIIIGLVVGSLIGVILAKRVAMTAMPELVAVFNGFGGGASALVAMGEFFRIASSTSETFDPTSLVTIGLSVFIGALTFTGSFIAFGKLSGFISGNALTFPGLNVINIASMIGVLVVIGFFTMNPSDPTFFWIILGVSLLIGITSVIPIGGADMPVVISLLNSYSGIAASMAGFVLGNNLLIVSGALVGAAGLILTNIMCVAMNRSLVNVIFGTFGANGSTGGGGTEGDKTVRETSADDLAIQVAYASKVVIVPGYGLAVAQAQHIVKEVATKLESRGVQVKYGIHPVAGRMPGHMNVLLAEADVPYDLLKDMDEINPEFNSTDVVLIIGANDVVNPLAKTDPGGPIYGMPILNVDEAKRTVVFKRSLSVGYAGIDNPLFYAEKNQMFFGDAKSSLQALNEALNDV